MVKNGYKDKVKYGYNFTPGDIEATPKNLVILVTISFFGAMAAAFSGVGPGFIFCPILVLIGIEAQVATATGMYVTLFTTLSATISVIIFKKIKLDYSLYIQILTGLATLPGIFFQRYIVEVTGRVSNSVFLLVSCLFLAMFSILIINIPLIIHRNQEGEKLFFITPYCDI